MTTKKLKKLSLRDTAIILLRAGIVSIPVKNKKPLILWSGYRTTPPTEGEVTSWPWEKATGSAILCIGDVVGLDYDDYEHPETFEAIRDKIPAGAFVEQSPRGGWHVFFKMQNPPEHGAYQLCQVKSRGILCNVYSKDITGLLNLPVVNEDVSGLTGLIIKKAVSLPDTRTGAGVNSIFNILKAPIPEGDRNVEFTRFAGLLRSRGLSGDVIEGILKAINTAHNDGVPEGEIQSIANSISKYDGDIHEQLPAPVWGAHYNKNGIPARKPELIVDILRRSHKLLISAPSKACKSFLAIRLALCIAHGRAFLNFPCTRGNVYLVNFEIDDGSYLHRVKAVADALGWTIPENILFHHLRGYSTNIEKLLPEIAACIDRSGKDFSAIILDPQYKLLRSEKIRSFSENDSVSMAYLYGQFDRYFSRRNISTVAISHFAKGNSSIKESIDRTVGSGAPMRDVDALGTLTPLDVDNAFRMEFSLREFAPQKPLSLSWKYPLHSVDGSLDVVSLKRPGRPGVSPETDDTLIYKTIQGTNKGMTQSAIRAVLAGKIGRYRVVESLERMVVSGKLKQNIGDKNAFIYAII